MFRFFRICITSLQKVLVCPKKACLFLQLVSRFSVFNFSEEIVYISSINLESVSNSEPVDNCELYEKNLLGDISPFAILKCKCAKHGTFSKFLAYTNLSIPV
jgi:hypothetical protein